MYTSRCPDHPFPRTMMDVQSGPGKAGRPAAKPKATKADISRERVLLAAAQIFAEMGYAGTTMRAVAERVGLRAASLYYHYRSKEDLVEAVLATGTGSIAASVQQALAQLPANTSARERIESALAAHLGSIISLGDFARATRRVLAQLPAPLRRKHVALRDAYSDLWLGLLESARDNQELCEGVDTHLARTFILGALNSAADWYKPGAKSLPEIAAQLVLVTRGIFRSNAAH